MRILQISNYLYPHIGGIEQVTRDIADSLLEHEVEQRIICFNEDVSFGETEYHRGDTVHDMVDSVSVVRCGCFAKLASQSISLSYARELDKLMRNFKPDIVIFHFPNPFAAHLLLRYRKRSFRLIVYWHLDITKQKILGKIFHGQTLRLLQRADKVITHTPNYIEGSIYLSKYKSKTDIISACIRTERLEITEAVRKRAEEIRRKYVNRIICFGIGRHVPYKGFHYLIQAAEYTDNNICVLIGGSGPLTETLQQEAEKVKNVELLGRLSQDELAAYYLACDIFVFPSITKNEAFGIALAEGMFFGKPAITFTIPGSGVNYVNLDGMTGIECANRDSRAYAQAINALARNTELRMRYGENAHQRVLDYFTYERFKEDVWNKIIL